MHIENNRLRIGTASSVKRPYKVLSFTFNSPPLSTSLVHSLMYSSSLDLTRVFIQSISSVLVGTFAHLSFCKILRTILENPILKNPTNCAKLKFELLLVLNSSTFAELNGS